MSTRLEFFHFCRSACIDVCGGIFIKHYPYLSILRSYLLTTHMKAQYINDTPESSEQLYELDFIISLI